MRRLVQILLLACLISPALADDKTITSKLSLKIGQTKQIGVFGSHTFDCNKGFLAHIEIIQAPSHGDLSQRENVDYIARNSISHTCEGSHFLGTAVDYTAKSAGTDQVRFDAVFTNGRAHNVLSIVNH